MKINNLGKLGSYLALMLFCTASISHAAIGPQGSNIERLFQALENVVRADSLCEKGYDSQAATRLRIATYRVRIVLADIRYTPGLSRAVEALEVTKDKLSDPYLRADEKVAFGLDCLAVALPVLIKRDARYSGNTQAALQHFRLAKLLSASYVFGPVENVLVAAKRFLRPVSCPIASANYRRAIEAINVAIDKINDSGLTADEKEFFVLDCLAVAERHIRGF